MFVLGMDIGYSNLKLAMGEQGSVPKTFVLPAGAGPIDLLPERINGGSEDCSVQVVIDGKKWAAGVEPERLQGWVRELHADYPSSKSYRALFYASLLLTERQEIDVLITGLPVDQYCNVERRESLMKMLEGTHQVTPKRSITVKSVRVVPQPAGAYVDTINNTSDEALLEAISFGKTIVVDPGFFSVDWVALDQGEIRYHSSGTSLKAMSVLLQEASKLLQDDHGGSPSVEKIERAIRAGEDYIFLFGEKVALKDYLAAASKTVAESALNLMRKTMREEGTDADVVLLTGGGAESYKDQAQSFFPQSKILMSGDSVLSNARGFWYCGQL